MKRDHNEDTAISQAQEGFSACSSMPSEIERVIDEKAQ